MMSTSRATVHKGVSIWVVSRTLLLKKCQVDLAQQLRDDGLLVRKFYNKRC